MKLHCLSVSSARHLSARHAGGRRPQAVIRGLLVAGFASFGSLAGVGLLATGPEARAADCDCCRSSCDACSVWEQRMKRGLIYKSLDSLAGGIEKVLGLDRTSSRCDEFACDHGCDAASGQELMHFQARPAMPMQAHPSVSAPAYTPTPLPPVRTPSTPTPIPSQPRGVPQIMPGTASPEPRIIPESMQQPNAIPQPKSEDSLFDALDDPFNDDEVRSGRPYRQVRPSGYLQRAGSSMEQPPRHSIAPSSPAPATPARKATYPMPATKASTPVRQTAALVELTPTDYLSSQRSASNDR